MKAAVKLYEDWGVMLIVELKDPTKVLVIGSDEDPYVTYASDDDFTELEGWEIFR